MNWLDVKWWQDRLYGNAAEWDPTQRFLGMLEGYLSREHEVLDLGAGAGRLNPYQLKGKVRRIVGVDLDQRVMSNPLLDEGLVADIFSLPFPDGSFDVAFCIHVLEHVAKPMRFVAEAARVLRPGGLFLALTPNRYHYVPLLALVSPRGVQAWYNKLRGRQQRDTFPTYYRLNTRRDLFSAFARNGFSMLDLRMIEVQPNYLTFCVPAFLLGAAYERIVNAFQSLAWLRVNMLCVFRKGEGGK